MESAWTFTTAQVLAFFNLKETTGLTTAQVSKSQQKHGLNEIPQDPPTPLWKLVLEQFQDQLVLILLLAAFVSFVLAFLETDETQKSTAYVEPIVILLILIANAVVGVVQETNAEKAIEVHFLSLLKNLGSSRILSG